MIDLWGGVGCQGPVPQLHTARVPHQLLGRPREGACGQDCQKHSLQGREGQCPGEGACHSRAGCTWHRDKGDTRVQHLAPITMKTGGHCVPPVCARTEVLVCFPSPYRTCGTWMPASANAGGPWACNMGLVHNLPDRLWGLVVRLGWGSGQEADTTRPDLRATGSYHCRHQRGQLPRGSGRTWASSRSQPRRG